MSSAGDDAEDDKELLIGFVSALDNLVATQHVQVRMLFVVCFEDTS